ncbi:hypothetical protein BC834DRAFT_891975 [Gloeopeniophorella convolvens]|nr:hypothetical protein BC834DRAFT_891975 [Gloeopeniophorella convolvens]
MSPYFLRETPRALPPLGPAPAKSPIVPHHPKIRRAHSESSIAIYAYMPRSNVSTPQFSPDRLPFDSPQIIADSLVLGPNSVSNTSSSMSYSVRTVNSRKSRMSYFFSRQKFRLGTSKLTSPPFTASLLPEGKVSQAVRQSSLPLVPGQPAASDTPPSYMQLPGDGERVMLAVASTWNNSTTEEPIRIVGRRLERAGQALLGMWHLEEFSPDGQSEGPKMHLAQHYAEVLLSVHGELVTCNIGSGGSPLLKELDAPTEALVDAFEKARESLSRPPDCMRTPQYVPLIDSTLFRCLVVTILRRLSLSDALNKFMITLGMIKRAGVPTGPSLLFPPQIVPQLGYEYESLRDLSVVEGDKLREDLLSLRLLIFQTRDETAKKEMQSIIEETLPAREVAQLML